MGRLARFVQHSWGVALLVPAVLLPAAGCAAGGDRPNVILVVVDTLRADHLSHYGYGRATATALDEFVSHATVFERAYAPAAWTAPSTASIHTGLLPARHGVSRAGGVLADEARTIAETLGADGWETLAVSFNPHVSRQTRFDQGFDRFDDFDGRSLDYPDIAEMMTRVESWLDRTSGRPFLLYLHPMNTHGPYRVPPAHRADLLGQPPGSEFDYLGPLMKGLMREQRLELRHDIDDAFLASLNEQYDTAIRYTTDRLGELFDALRRRGRYENSLIIVTSDHGEELFDHRGFSHGYSLYEEILRVPLYVKLPHQREGRRVGTPVSLVDIYPTIQQAVGGRPDDDVDGLSLVRLAGGRSADGGPAFDRPLLAQTAWARRCVGRAIVDGPFKLIEIERNYEGLRDRLLLFDLERDPREQFDLARQRPDVVRKLAAEMRRRQADLEGRSLAPADNVLEQMDERRLRSLGYVN